MSETKYKEFWIHNFPQKDITPWENHPNKEFNRYTNTHDIPDIMPPHNTIHVIEYSALVEEKQKTAEMLEAIRLSAGFAHAVQPGGPMEQILDKLIKKYGDL